MFAQYRAIDSQGRARPTSTAGVSQVPSRERVGHVLGEDAHGVHALGRDAGVVGRLEIELGPEPVGSRRFAAAW